MYLCFHPTLRAAMLMRLVRARTRRLILATLMGSAAACLLPARVTQVSADQPTPSSNDHPTLIYSTYYGSTDAEERHSTSGDALAIDASGHAYITGMTSSESLPLKDPYDSSHSGSLWDGFIAKLDTTGSALAYATYFGSGSETIVEGIAVDPQGNMYLTGSARRGFQVHNSPIQDDIRGDADAFVAKLRSDGATLVYAALLGGADYDSGDRIAVDADGYAYVTGETRSTDFPTVSPLQAQFKGPGRGDGDAFVAKLAPDGSRLVYATYLGGSAADGGSGIAADAAGAAYVTGFTLSEDFPVANALQPKRAGDGDAFVVKISPDGSSLDYSTYLGGGAGGEDATSIIVDTTGSVYIVGTTASSDFPLAHPVQSLFNAGVQTASDPDNMSDAFVAQLAPDGHELTISTYLGGGSRDRGLGIGRDVAGNMYVGGQTTSFDFPTVRPLQDHYGGDNNGMVTDSFITRFAPGGAGVLYSTYFGGVSWDDLRDLAVDRQGNVYITGAVDAPSPDFPLAGTPFQTRNIGIRNAFVAKISDDFTGPARPFPTPTPQTADTGPSRPPPGFEKRWLQAIPCAPPCWEDIIPGQTTLTDAVRLLQQNPGVQPQSVLSRPYGQPEEHTGYIQWRWLGSEGGGEVSYQGTEGKGEAIVTYISPGLGGIPSADASFTLGDVIAAYGEPTHIHATGFFGMHGDGPFYTMDFYYEKHGMALESNGIYHTKPHLDSNIRLDRVTFSTDPVHPSRPTFAAIPDDPSTGPQVWQGFKEFDFYCRNTSIGAKAGSPCPGPGPLSPLIQVVIYVALGGFLLFLAVRGFRTRLRSRGSSRSGL
jgi:hypothetical protein